MAKESTVPFVEGTPDWSTIPTLEIKEPLENKCSEAKAWAQICYTQDALLVHMIARDQEVRVVEQGRLGCPCQDSCLEFFFSPIAGDLRYFNFECNAGGCLYVGYGSNPEDHLRLIWGEEKYDALFHPVIKRFENGWDLYFQVPYSFIELFFPAFSAKSGVTIRGNFYNCGDLLQQPHYITWNPIVRTGKMRFHTPAEFGYLHFA